MPFHSLTRITHLSLPETPFTSPAPTPILIQPPTTLVLPQLAANDDKDNMVETEFFFYGNGCAGKNPQDFIKKFKNKDLKDEMKEEKKLEMFYNRLKSGNSMEEWDDTLTMVQTASWATVKAAFTICWPKKVLQAKSVQDKGNRLKALERR